MSYDLRPVRSVPSIVHTYRVALVAMGPIGGFVYATRFVRTATSSQALAKAKDHHNGATGHKWYGERVERCQKIGLPR